MSQYIAIIKPILITWNLLMECILCANNIIFIVCDFGIAYFLYGPPQTLPLMLPPPLGFYSLGITSAGYNSYRAGQICLLLFMVKNSPWHIIILQLMQTHFLNEQPTSTTDPGPPTTSFISYCSSSLLAMLRKLWFREGSVFLFPDKLYAYLGFLFNFSHTY